MRTRALWVCALSLMISSWARADPQPVGTLDVMAAGQHLSFDETKQFSIKFWLQQLMLSSLYRNVVLDSSLDEWQQRLSSQTHIHCVYATTATLAIPERRTLTFDEALITFTGDYPDFVFIKRGADVLRLAKYDPWVLRKLFSEAGIAPASTGSPVERGLF